MCDGEYGRRPRLDLGGFIYGPQYLVARKHMIAAFGDCTELWENARSRTKTALLSPDPSCSP